MESFPASTREILKELQENTKIPKAVSEIAKKLLEILDYTLVMRNHYQITGKPEVLDLSDPRTLRYKKVIAQSMEIATYISDSGPSKEKVDEHFMELLKKAWKQKRNPYCRNLVTWWVKTLWTSDSRKKKALPSHNRPKEIDLNFLIL